MDESSGQRVTRREAVYFLRNTRLSSSLACLTGFLGANSGERDSRERKGRTS